MHERADADHAYPCLPMVTALAVCGPPRSPALGAAGNAGQFRNALERPTELHRFLLSTVSFVRKHAAAADRSTPGFPRPPDPSRQAARGPPGVYPAFRFPGGPMPLPWSPGSPAPCRDPRRRDTGSPPPGSRPPAPAPSRTISRRSPRRYLLPLLAAGSGDIGAVVAAVRCSGAGGTKKNGSDQRADRSVALRPSPCGWPPDGPSHGRSPCRLLLRSPRTRRCRG